MGIVAGILDAAADAAKKAEAERITEIHITVGELTEIVDFALHFAFEALTPGTLAEGATLAVNRIGARSRCVECDTEFDHGRFEMACPDCGSYFCKLLQGKELRIDSIEADAPDAMESRAPSAGK